MSVTGTATSDDSSSISSFYTSKNKRVLRGMQKRQLINGNSPSPITISRLSHDSSYLATGNQDGVLCIYATNDSPGGLIFKPSPIHVFKGHQGAILGMGNKLFLFRKTWLGHETISSRQLP
jgi:WD40 repeat protein